MKPNWLGALFAKDASFELEAATQLQVVPVPRVKANQQTNPSYLKTATPNKDSALPLNDRRVINKDLTTYRAGADTRTVIRDFASTTPDLSAAVNAYLRTAITSSYTAIAKNMDGTFNRDATSLLQQLLTRFDVVQNYDDGFSGVSSMRSNSESLGKELMWNGACALELVLGKDRLPRALQPVSVTQIIFYPDKSGKWLRPAQKLGGEEIDLDIPTFFYTALDQDLLEPYAASPLESALQPALWSHDFMNDLRKIVKRVIHPRLGVKIDYEKFKKTIPAEAGKDDASLKAYMDRVIGEIQTMVDGLNPEDALVYFDQIGVEYINNGNISLKDEYTVLGEMMDAKMSTGAKTLPSVLGHGSGSQNVASSETLLFMKNADGAVREKLNEIYSRALTLAVRLFGLDVYVEFKYAAIDLRPESELEAFSVMKQSRTLELLSYGFITDDEASMALTGQLTPAGFKPLSGTQFLTPVAPADAAGKSSPNSNTGANQSKKPKTPTQPKSELAEELEPQAETVSVVVNNDRGLTAADVREAVRAALPAADTEAMEALARAGEETASEVQALRSALAEAIEGITAELAQAARKDPADDFVQELSARFEQLSARVEQQSLVQPPAPVPAEPVVLNLTIVNEAKNQSVTKTGKATRNPDGSLSLEITEPKQE